MIAVVAVAAMLSLAAAAALALYDSSKPKEGDVYYATVKNFHSVVLSQPGAVAVQFFDSRPVRTIVSALDADDPARVPNVPAHRAADEREQLISMGERSVLVCAPRDADPRPPGAARSASARRSSTAASTGAATSPSPATSCSTSPRIEEDALTKYEEKKKEWEARAAERRALEAPWGPPRKKRRRKAKREEL